MGKAQALGHLLEHAMMNFVGRPCLVNDDYGLAQLAAGLVRPGDEIAPALPGQAFQDGFVNFGQLRVRQLQRWYEVDGEIR